MTFAYIRISLLSARRVSSSYTEQIGCMQTVNTRKNSVGRNHVRILFWLTMSCMSSCKTIISSPFASHDSSPCSIQIDSKPKENTNFLIGLKLCLNPYSEEVRCISNDNTRISSLAVSHVKRLCHRIVVYQRLNKYSLRWIKSFL